MKIDQVYRSGYLEWTAVCDSFAHHISTMSTVLDENGMIVIFFFTSILDNWKLLPGINSTCY